MPRVPSGSPSSDSGSSDCTFIHPAPHSRSSHAKPLKANKNSNRRVDQYAISADSWTPIVGAPLPKRLKSAHPPKQPESVEVDVLHDPQKGSLVRLFEADVLNPATPLDPVESATDPVFVSAEQKVSLYVECFEEILNTVLDHEQYLFSPQELRVFRGWSELPYPSRYLFVRLFMRKNSNWFRIDKLQNYNRDIDDVHRACQELAQARIPPGPPNPRLPQLPTNNGRSSPPQPSGSLHNAFSPREAPHFDPCLLSLDAQPQNPSPESVEKWCFAMEMLSDLVESALEVRNSQPALASDSDPTAHSPSLPPISSAVRVQAPPPNCAPPPSPPCSPPALCSPMPQLDYLATMSTDRPSSINTDELFSCMNMDELKALAKQVGANPHTARDMIIVGLKDSTAGQSTLCGSAPSRGKGRKQLSIKFDKHGLKDRQLVTLNSKILDMVGPCIKLSPAVCSLFSRLHLVFYRSSAVSENSMAPAMLARMNLRVYPSYQVARAKSIFESREALIKYESSLQREKQFDELTTTAPDTQKRIALNTDEEKARRRAIKEERLKQALVVFDEAWVEWQQVVLEEDARFEVRRLRLGGGTEGDELAMEHDRLNYHKKRFHPGWPLTRIVSKGAHVLSRFHKYQDEVQVLVALLNQTHFRRGQRGAWYDRLALVLTNHLSDASTTPEQRDDNRRSAIHTCEEGLRDPYTHQIYRLHLTRRLNRLKGQPQASLSNSNQTNEDDITHRTKSISRQQVDSGRETGKKTTWLSKVDGSFLTVEEVSLEYYASKGWRGFHAEGRILTMIFSLLFWDVLFAPIDGVFETPYQNAPLDMASDAFAIVRAPLISRLFAAIEARGISEALMVIKENYNREHPRRAWCVGINWERYGLEDLLEIVECLGVKALLVICKVLAEDWAQRVAGVPDLCLWNYARKRCRFVEVKGPDDRLSERQKAWIGLLTDVAKVEVEVLSVTPM